MKRTIVFCVATVAMLCAMLYAAGRLLGEEKKGVARYIDFFSQEQDFDVLIAGSSHGIVGVLPMELWRDYGIVSYNCCGNGNSLPVSYWVLTNMLEYTTPRLVVLDVWDVWYANGGDEERLDNPHTQTAHRTFDALPLSKAKWDAVQALWSDSAQRMEFMWPFSVYHDRWTEANIKEFRWTANKNVSKGAEHLAAVADITPPALVGADEKEDVQTTGKAYIARIIELCHSRGIEIMLLNTPMPSGAQRQRYYNSIRDVADAYGVRYLNANDEGIVDFELDLADGSFHLNAAGAKKLTDFLGRYIREHYDIPDRRSQEAYAFWNDDYAEYLNEKISRLRKQKSSLTNYLVLLNDPDFEAQVMLEGITLAEFEQLEPKAYRLLEAAGLAQSVLERDAQAGGEAQMTVSVSVPAMNKELDATVFSLEMREDAV